MFDAYEVAVGYHVPLQVLPSRFGGIGVFARNAITQGEVVEKVPVTLLRHGDLRRYDAAKNNGARILEQYLFGWSNQDPSPDNTLSAFAHGKGSLYNHNASANAEFTTGLSLLDNSRSSPFFKEKGTIAAGVVGAITFIAKRDIAPGEEITVSYFPIVDDEILEKFKKTYNGHVEHQGPSMPIQSDDPKLLRRVAAMADPRQYGDPGLEALVADIIAFSRIRWKSVPSPYLRIAA